LGFVFVADDAGKIVVNDFVVGAVIDEIKEKNIDNLALDPFSAFHRVSENDNTKLLEVMNQLAIVADETHAACELVAHPRKVSGEQLTVDDIRGGSAQHGAIRALRLGNGMGKDDGGKAGLPEGEYRRYFYLVDGKPSLRQWSDTQSWRRMASIDVKLDDGSRTSVGAVERWDWPSAEDAEAARDETTRKSLTSELTDAILWAIAKPSREGLRADKQSPNWAGYSVMPAVGLDVTRKADKSQMDTWLKLLVKSEDLKEYQDSGPDRHPAMFLEISEKTRKRLDESGK
jgi:AAA domain